MSLFVIYKQMAEILGQQIDDALNPEFSYYCQFEVFDIDNIYIIQRIFGDTLFLIICIVYVSIFT